MASSTSLSVGLFSLSNEILLLIAENLEYVADVSSLLSVNRWLLQLLTPLLHKHAVKDRDRYSAMQWAALKNLPSLAELLIAKGIDPDHVSENCILQPLLLAISSDNVPMVTSLVGHGADVNLRSHKMGSTPLIEAVMKHNYLVVQILLEEGADPALSSRDCVGRGFTPLHAAVRYSPDLPIVDILCEWGAPIDAVTVDRFGYTPLTMVVSLGYLEVVERLLNHGADVHVKDAIGRTALEIAAYYAGRGEDMDTFIKIGQMLIERGAQVPVDDSEDDERDPEYIYDQDSDDDRRRSFWCQVVA